MIKNKKKNKTKRSKFIQQSKKQLSRESNLNHLLGRLAPRPRCHVTKAFSGKIIITIYFLSNSNGKHCLKLVELYLS